MIFDLFGSTANRRQAFRSIESPQVPLTSNALLELLGSGFSNDAGVTVTEEGSLAMSAVWRATSLISGLGGSLPLPVFDTKTNTEVEHLLLDDPHPEMTRLEFHRLSYVHRCLWGNSYAQKTYDKAQRIMWLYPINPWNVKVGRAKKPDPLNPTGKVFLVTVNGKEQEFTPREILHVPHLGYDGITGCSPVRAASQAIALSLAGEKAAAKLFGSGNLLSGILQTEQRLTQEQAETIQERWKSKFMGTQSAHEVAVIDSGAQFTPMTMSNVDAQMLESRDYEVTELSRFFGVPPYLMFQTDKSTSWGTALEQQATGFVRFDLVPQWLAPYEQRLTKELLRGQGRKCKYNVDALLRGDTMARAELYRVMREIGGINANELRDLEDKNPVTGGEMYLQPMNMVPLGTDGVALQKELADKAIAAKKAGGVSGGDGS